MKDYICPNQRKARRISCPHYYRGKCKRATWRFVDNETNLPFCEIVNSTVENE
jgi:hypothetical protein